MMCYIAELQARLCLERTHVCRNLTEAGFETFWDVLQYYPKEYVYHDTQLSHDSHVIVPGTVTKAFGVRNSLFITIKVDTMQPTPISSAATAVQSPPEQSSTSSSLVADEEDSDVGTSTLSSDGDSGSSLLLNENGRTVTPEETSTSTSGASSSQEAPIASGLKPPIVHVRKYIPNKRALYGEAGKYSQGTQVVLQGKVTEASKSGMHLAVVTVPNVLLQTGNRCHLPLG